MTLTATQREMENADMPSPKNVMEIYKHLDKTNCRKCEEPTCLAFAAAVFKGQKPLDRCPFVDNGVLDQYGDAPAGPLQIEVEQEKMVRELKEKIAELDFSSVAQRLGAVLVGDKLAVNCLGKDVFVAKNGDLSSDIHIHAWITMTILNYILHGNGKPVSGNWVPFRELKGGAAWQGLFGQQCEKPLKKVADTHTDLFEILIQLFNGRPVGSHFDADISLVLHPLPKIPILICYWKPEEGLESKLSLFFDQSAQDNLNIESVYQLGTGLVVMFEKIALRHGGNGRADGILCK